MKTYVFDASVLFAFLRERPGASKVDELLKEARRGRAKLLMSAANYGEVYGLILRGFGPEQALSAIIRGPSLTNRSAGCNAAARAPGCRRKGEIQALLRRQLRRRAGSRAQSHPGDQRFRFPQARSDFSGCLVEKLTKVDVVAVDPGESPAAHQMPRSSGCARRAY